ncbi:MAG: hypothetical protein ABIP39_15405 [Polyangiaceae bacterium]
MRLLALFPLILSLPLPVLASGCSLNQVGIVPGSDASTSDVIVPEAGPPPTGWCATTGTGHDFCADFDTSLRGTEPGAWCGAIANGVGCGATELGGTVTRDTALIASKPASASAQTMLGLAQSQAFLTREFPGSLHPLKLAFDVQLDAFGIGSGATLAAITLETFMGSSHGVSLVATPPGDAGPNAGLVVVESKLSGPPTQTALLLSIPPSKFVRVELVIGIAPNTVTVTVDGASSSILTIDAPGSADGRALQLGLEATPADAWAAHFDDVTFDFSK